jgi:hypothetical protein
VSTKNSEHTWGIHNAVVPKAALWAGWDNVAFHAARRAADSPYAAVERAWRQQRTFGVDAAVASLADTPLHTDITARLAALRPLVPPAAGQPPPGCTQPWAAQSVSCRALVH